MIVLAGTAGTGKSTAIMRLGLHLVGKDIECAYTSVDFDVSPADLRSLEGLGDLPDVLLIDDADRFGAEASMLARDLRRAEGNPLIVLAVRTSRVGRISDRLKLLDVEHRELIVPRLTDSDIDSLLRVLDSANRLGYSRTSARPNNGARSELGREPIVIFWWPCSRQPQGVDSRKNSKKSWTNSQVSNGMPTPWWR